MKNASVCSKQPQHCSYCAAEPATRWAHSQSASQLATSVMSQSSLNEERQDAMIFPFGTTHFACSIILHELFPGCLLGSGMSGTEQHTSPLLPRGLLQQHWASVVEVASLNAENVARWSLQIAEHVSSLETSVSFSSHASQFCEPDGMVRCGPMVVGYGRTVVYGYGFRGTPQAHDGACGSCGLKEKMQACPLEHSCEH